MAIEASKAVALSTMDSLPTAVNYTSILGEKKNILSREAVTVLKEINENLETITGCSASKSLTKLSLAIIDKFPTSFRDFSRGTTRENYPKQIAFTSSLLQSFFPHMQTEDILTVSLAYLLKGGELPSTRNTNKEGFYKESFYTLLCGTQIIGQRIAQSAIDGVFKSLGYSKHNENLIALAD